MPCTASQLLERLARSLDTRAIPYMIIGGQAVLLYGEPRLTGDIDITVDLVPDQLSAVQAVASDVGLTALVDDPDAFARQTFVVPYGHTPTGLRVDFIFSFTPYEREAMQRVRVVAVGPARVRFASPEDVLVHKIFAGRPRDLEDARGILAKNPGVDIGYVRTWLRALSEVSAQPLEATFAALAREVGLIQ